MPKSLQPLEPLPGFAVLKEYKLNEKIAGRLLMPTDSQNPPSLGEVIAVGDAPFEVKALYVEIAKLATEGITQAEAAKLREKLNTPVEVGSIMAYQNYGGQELSLEGQKYFLVPFDKLLAKVNIKESK